jgi:hypothetical protein
MKAYAFVWLTACTAAPAPVENEMPAAVVPLENETRPEEHHFEPAWRTGDTWTVRLRMLVPSMGGPRYPPVIEEDDWTYRVVQTTPEAVHISATTDEKWFWHFTFAPNGRILGIDNAWWAAPFVAVADAPLLHPVEQLAEQGADAWPRFPLEEDFGPDDAELRQRSRPFGNELEVAIIRAGYRAGYDRWLEQDFVRTATQRWEPGRPWWSVLRIDEEYTNRHGTKTHLAIEGEVIAWPAGTPE